MANYVPPNIQCLNVNVGPNVGIPAYQRKHVIKGVLAEDPTLAFVQEFTWKKGLQHGAFKNFKIPEHLCFVGNVDSGFIYDNRYLDCEQLNLNSKVIGIYDHLDSHFVLSRSCICKFKSKGPQDFGLLCVCWHGYHKITDEHKKTHLRSLFYFLLKVKVDQGNLPLMIGGDFNLSSDIVREVCREISSNLDVISQPNTIMMWILSKDFHNTFNVLVKDTRTFTAFDHDVLTIELQIVTPVDDLPDSHNPVPEVVARPIRPQQTLMQPMSVRIKPQQMLMQPISVPIRPQQTLSQGKSPHQTLNSQYNRSVVSSIKLTTTRVCDDQNIEQSTTQVIRT